MKIITNRRLIGFTEDTDKIVSELLRKMPGKYQSINHIIRCALIRLWNYEKSKDFKYNESY